MKNTIKKVVNFFFPKKKVYTTTIYLMGISETEAKIEALEGVFSIAKKKKQQKWETIHNMYYTLSLFKGETGVKFETI